ncbi:hypothetical protein HY478_02190 [Candidatus Uhrbacteria bacterium]|nr:hypothetical protein [Candidatus Uhrbacteria bacterium]
MEVGVGLALEVFAEQVVQKVAVTQQSVAAGVVVLVQVVVAAQPASAEEVAVPMRAGVQALASSGVVEELKYQPAAVVALAAVVAARHPAVRVVSVVLVEPARTYRRNM